ncbi:MAG: OmpA family protein [Acidobacteria bacterium]|nr:MAG: OmpA family protein [Acidobacteriota bacterium]
MQRKVVVLSSIVLFLGTSISSFGAPPEKAKAKGMIISRTGETLQVKTSDATVTVVLDDGSRTVDRTGLFGLGKTDYSNAVLIPGLKVDLSGVSDDQGRVVAKTITVDGDDLEAAQMIQSGLHPTAEQVAANVRTLETHNQRLGEHETQLAAQKESIETNQQNIAANKQQIHQNMQDIKEHTDRFMQLADYDVKTQATVKFNVGSAKISPEDEEQLKQLAQTATGINGYIVEVVGYADSTGSAAMNTKLSENRAKAVIAYLVQQGNVPIRHIVAPGAMGEYGAAATNETKEGRADNRRVEIKVLVNKGIAGS